MPVQDIGNIVTRNSRFNLITVDVKHCKEILHLALNKVKVPPLAVGKVPSTESAGQES